MKHKVSVTINGQRREDEVDARLLLVHYIRDVAGLTGTHIGCDTSQCGACTIHVDGKAVKSCTMFAVQADGRQLMTIEGMAKDGQLHPLQQAFWDEHGLQCGYCTPGFIMAAAYLLDQNPNPSDDEIRKGLEGNLCRCTGYVNIVKSVKTAAQRMGGQKAVPAPAGQSQPATTGSGS
jgi:carbon-monoxide dehydrogenase small subunit